MEQARVVGTKKIDIESVQMHPDNARRGDEGRIEASLRANGQYAPIVVHAETGNILAHNHVWKVARQLGWKRILATTVSCDDQRAKAILLVDNRSSDDSGYDNQALLSLLGDLGSGDALAAAGYNDAEVDDLRALLEEAEEPGDLPRSYLEGGDRFEPDTYERKAAYQKHSTRSVVLTLDGDEYVRFSSHLEVLATRYGTETNTETVMAAVSELVETENGS